MLNEEKKILCFQTDSLDWEDIENRIINFYGLGEKRGYCTQELNYGIMSAMIYTDKGTFDCEIGVLNEGNEDFLVTVYPSEVLKKLREDKENNKTFRKTK